MKIGILTHFDSFQPSYALAVGWHERAKLLEQFGQDFDFLVNSRCKPDLYPHQKSILPSLKSSMPFGERVKIYTDFYLDNFKEYDAILTADVMYQRKGNFLAYNQAVRDASKHLKAKWYHWIHSAWVERPDPLPEYPDNLRFVHHRGSKLVYLNSFEIAGMAQMFDTSQANCACVYNPKDPRTFFNLSPLVCEIIEKLKFWEKDIIQIFPHCSTRMESKGIIEVAELFGYLKKKGKKVALVFANANSRSVQERMDVLKGLFEKQFGLKEWEDFLFTSNLTEKFRPVPRSDIADLFKLSNLFVFASWRETVGNVFQEAKISGCLLVLNTYLPCLREMGGTDPFDVLYWPTTHKIIGKTDQATGDVRFVNYQPSRDEWFDGFCDTIIDSLRGRGTNQERWKFSRELIWENQLKPLLYGGDK